MRKLAVGAVVLMALGVFAASATAQKGRLRIPTRWQVVDANGVVVGVPVAYDPGSAAVLLQVGNQFAELIVRPTYLTGRNWSNLYFASPDCTGTPYTGVQPEELAYMATWGPAVAVAFGFYSATTGSTAFYVPSSEPRQTITPFSALTIGGTPAEPQCRPAGGSPVELQPLVFGFNIPAYAFPLSVRLVE